MKALNKDCVWFEIFLPGHLYSSAAGEQQTLISHFWRIQIVLSLTSSSDLPEETSIWISM
jgi:hypothetical protein